jgi:hypothetical protein
MPAPFKTKMGGYLFIAFNALRHCADQAAARFALPDTRLMYIFFVR